MSVSETAASIAFPAGWIPRGLLGDAGLARLATRGDRRAFERIFERYHLELYRYCWGILGDPDEAQDALQSTMASALRALPGEERQIALRPWLYRVAHNEAISILRQRVTNVDPHPLHDPPAPGADADAEGRERLRDLVADLAALPERQRGALVMRELSDLSYGEIGAALAASKPAARQVVYEARAALRELQAGREMECETARRAISERDGRVLRGRRLGAHLRTCESCRDFSTGISQRRFDLRGLCPPLPPLAASGLLSTLLGEAGAGGVGTASGGLAGGAATGALAGGGGAGAAGAAGTTIAGSAAVKGACVAAAAAVVIGAGAANVSGVLELSLVGGRDAPRIEQGTLAASHGAAARDGANRGPQAQRRGEPVAQASERAGGVASLGERGRGREQSQEGPTARRASESRENPSAAHGEPATNPDSPPATSNATPPGRSDSSQGSHGNGHGGASSSHRNAPASPAGLANAAANAPTLRGQAHDKPAAGPRLGARSRLGGGAPGSSGPRQAE